MLLPFQIELKTAPVDFRFPTTNQTRHCFTRYIEFHRCMTVKGENSGECEKFAKYYRSLCPGEWVDKWNEQRDNGTFPGPLWKHVCLIPLWLLRHGNSWTLCWFIFLNTFDYLYRVMVWINKAVYEYSLIHKFLKPFSILS